MENTSASVRHYSGGLSDCCMLRPAALLLHPHRSRGRSIYHRSSLLARRLLRFQIALSPRAVGVQRQCSGVQAAGIACAGCVSAPRFIILSPRPLTAGTIWENIWWSLFRFVPRSRHRQRPDAISVRVRAHNDRSPAEVVYVGPYPGVSLPLQSVPHGDNPNRDTRRKGDDSPGWGPT